MLGLVTFVAPLTATIMAAADPDHVSIASAVNNAIARAAALAALAVVPVVSGLAAAAGAAEVTHTFRVAIVIVACIAAAAGPLVFIGLSPVARCAANNAPGYLCRRRPTRCRPTLASARSTPALRHLGAKAPDDIDR